MISAYTKFIKQHPNSLAAKAFKSTLGMHQMTCSVILLSGLNNYKRAVRLAVVRVRCKRLVHPATVLFIPMI